MEFYFRSFSCVILDIFTGFIGILRKNLNYLLVYFHKYNFVSVFSGQYNVYYNINLFAIHINIKILNGLPINYINYSKCLIL